MGLGLGLGKRGKDFLLNPVIFLLRCVNTIFSLKRLSKAGTQGLLCATHVVRNLCTTQRQGTRFFFFFQKKKKIGEVNASFKKHVQEWTISGKKKKGFFL